MEDTIVEQLDDPRLARVATKIKGVLQPGIRFGSTPCADSELLPGESRLGGSPDVPDGFEWPTWREKPLAFLAQLNMAELSRFSTAEPLPDTGWLLFFYDAEQSTWGFDPQDLGSWSVVYVTGDSENLQQTSVPIESFLDGKYAACHVAFFEALTAPSAESPEIQDLALSPDEFEAYFDITSPDGSTQGKCHQLLGLAQAIQGEMRLECQLASNGVYCGNPQGYEGPRAVELAKGVDDWILLLQVDTDDKARMMWGDVGRLYFWIKRGDLARSDFSKVWMVLQCG